MSEPLANHVKPHANAKIKLANSLFPQKRKHLTTHLKSVLRYTVYVCERTKKHFLNEERSMDAAAKKRGNTSGVGKSNNYYEVYTSFNNTH